MRISTSVLAAVLLLAGPATATETLFTFEKGDWWGIASKVKRTGAFSNCEVHPRNPNDRKLRFLVNGSASFFLRAFHSKWKWAPGSDGYVVAPIYLDGVRLGTRRINFFNGGQVLVHLGSHRRIAKVLKRRRVLTFRGPRRRYDFDLEDISGALAALNHCIKKAQSLTARDPSGDRAASGGPVATDVKRAGGETSQSTERPAKAPQPARRKKEEAANVYAQMAPGWRHERRNDPTTGKLRFCGASAAYRGNNQLHFFLRPNLDILLFVVASELKANKELKAAFPVQIAIDQAEPLETSGRPGTGTGDNFLVNIWYAPQKFERLADSHTMSFQIADQRYVFELTGFAKALERMDRCVETAILGTPP